MLIHRFAWETITKRWLPSFLAILSITLVACGAAATSTLPPPPPAAATQAPAPTTEVAPTIAIATPAGPAATATPLPVVKPTIAPTQVMASRDSIMIAINEEPSIPDPWLSTTLYPNQVTQNVAQSFSFFGPDFEDSATAGFTGFEQLTPQSWRLHLREGVKFHNGEEWNAEAAKFTIDALGGSVEFQPYSQVGDSHAEVIDDHTVDFMCDSPCPVLPRFSQFHTFVAPGYRQNNSQEDRDASGQIVGWGPYKWVNWDRGVSITLERYEDYIAPDTDNFISQAPTIQDVTYVWREEELVRVAMVQTGEADLIWAVGVDLADQINNSEHGKTVKVVSGEVYTANVDTIWHPELRKLKVRQALVHAIDCETLALALFGPESKCSSGPNGILGTLGVNEQNAQPIYTYDPDRARQLLTEANYNPENEIDFFTREGRYAKDVELSESLITFWEDVGIKVKLNVVEGGVWRQKHLTGPATVFDAALDAGATIEEAAAAVHQSPFQDPCLCSPGLVLFAPGGEYFDFGRQINFYMNCAANRSKNCNAEWHQLGQEALAKSGEERREAMTEAYNIFSANVLQLPLMEIVSVWGVNKDLDFVNMPGGRRILVNTIHWTQ